MKSRPVLIGNSVLAALQVLASAAALSDAIGVTAFGLFSIGVAAATVGFNTYVQGVVVPTADVAAYVNNDGHVVTGPAAAGQNGQPAIVHETGPPV
jgi:hypothetical protein